MNSAGSSSGLPRTPPYNINRPEHETSGPSRVREEESRVDSQLPSHHRCNYPSTGRRCSLPETADMGTQNTAARILSAVTADGEPLARESATGESEQTLRTRHKFSQPHTRRQDARNAHAAGMPPQRNAHAAGMPPQRNVRVTGMSPQQLVGYRHVMGLDHPSNTGPYASYSYRGSAPLPLQNAVFYNKVPLIPLLPQGDEGEGWHLCWHTQEKKGGKGKKAKKSEPPIFGIDEDARPEKSERVRKKKKAKRKEVHSLPHHVRLLYVDPYYHDGIYSSSKHGIFSASAPFSLYYPAPPYAHYPARHTDSRSYRRDLGSYQYTPRMHTERAHHSPYMMYIGGRVEYPNVQSLWMGHSEEQIQPRY